MSDIEIEIDGKVLKAQPNQMVIQVADAAGIYIPRFCYHKHLSVAANCRMCLVEVEKAPKPLPACATPVMPGMKIFTRSAKALAAQKAVMEFLLINHPLDCPICDQGGECELQDLSMGYGSAESYFNEGKRAVKDKDIGPLVATEMTRCIHCTRCVRFGDEVAGLRELGGVGRGEHMEITTYVSHALQSEVSGNIIDLCPVGALTSKPYRFTARAWELVQYPSIAAHDCVGSNIYVHTRGGDVMRVVPQENTAINETWISDRDRFSYEGLHHEDRLAKPLIRVENTWQETDWETALEFAAAGLNKVAGNPGQVGALMSPSATTEEGYLLQKLMRHLGSSHLDHRLRQTDFSDQDSMPAFPSLNMAIPELEQQDVIVLIGSNIQKEQPLLGLRVRKASLQGAQIITVNMLDYRYHFQTAAKKIVAPQEFVAALAGIAKALHPAHPALTTVNVTEQDQAIAACLQKGKKITLILGALAFNHPQAATVRALAKLIAESCQATVSFLSEGANAAGAWLAGVLPHRTVEGKAAATPGLDAQAMLQQPRQAYILLNVEPDLDCANPVAASRALEQAEFVVALSSFKNPLLEKMADVILPIAMFTETAGTFVNTTGEWQSFKGTANAFGESRPGWKVLRVLGNFLNAEGFEFTSAEEVRQELLSIIGQAQQPRDVKPYVLSTITQAVTNNLSRMGEVPMYAIDPLVRRAKSLQATQMAVEGLMSAVRLHPQTAQKLGITEQQMVTIKQQNNSVRLPAIYDARVPLQAVFIASGIFDTSKLSEMFGEVEIL